MEIFIGSKFAVGSSNSKSSVFSTNARASIITPYTSYLVTEPSAIGFEAQDEIAADALQNYMAAPMAVTGEEAVGRAAAESEIREAGVAPDLSKDEAEVVQFAGTRTFRWVNGVWIDTAFDPGSMDTLKVPFLSEDYFSLALSRPDFGAALALGSRVIIVGDQAVYEIVEEGESGDRIIIPEPESEEILSDEAGEITINPEERDRQNNRQGFSLPCLGASLMGLTSLVFVTRTVKPKTR